MEEVAARQVLRQEAKSLTGAELSPANPKARQAGQYRAGQSKTREIPVGALPTPVSCLPSHSTEGKGLSDMTAEADWDLHLVATDRQTGGQMDGQQSPFLVRSSPRRGPRMSRPLDVCFSAQH